MDKIKMLFPYKEKEFISSFSRGQRRDWSNTIIKSDTFFTKTKGAGIKVAIIDTGCAKTHPDLEGAIFDIFNPYSRSWPEDRVGHGTHVAGIIGARDNDIGVVGIAPECQLLIAKGLDDDGFGDWNKIVACIQWSVHQCADVINLSLGDMREPPQLVHETIKWAVGKGVIIIAAAGNDPNSTPSRPTKLDVAYPARYDEVISVAAIDKNGNLAYFSNRGKILNFLAPGVDIFSTYPLDKYAILTGSSQASPMISGICALLKAADKEKMKNYKDAIFSLNEISTKNDAIAKITKNYNIGIPSFSNISIQSIGEYVDEKFDEEIAKKLDTFDWKWTGNKMKSKSMDIMWIV